jgi:hypothetical protein
MASSQGTQPQHLIVVFHSADKHHIIYSFSNTTSYCTFYGFFSSFHIKFWPMWLANSRRQPYFIQLSDTHKTTHRTDKPYERPVLCQRTFSSVFCIVFFTWLKCTVKLSVCGALNTVHHKYRYVLSFLWRKSQFGRLMIVASMVVYHQVTVLVCCGVLMKHQFS